MKPKPDNTLCTLGELMIYHIALSIENGILAFHGFGSPLIQLALHLAKKNHAPDLILIAGATYAVNPKPAFLTPTTNDQAMSLYAECTLDIEELFDIAASGRMGRMFLSGLQIDKWGNMNVTGLGKTQQPKLKLPGGGGGCNLSCDVDKLTIWTTGHRTRRDASGKRLFRLVEQCDFITSLGHCGQDGIPRSELNLQGQGPDCLITDLGIFDFNAQGHLRLKAVYPDTDADLINENTEFDLPVVTSLETAALPDPDMIDFIRRLDPLKIHERELTPGDRQRHFVVH